MQQKERKRRMWCHIRCMRVNEHGMRWCTVYNKCIWEYVWIPWVKFASRPRYCQFTITVTVIFCWAPASAAPCPQHGAIGGLAAWPLMSDFNHKRSHILRPEASGYSSQQLKRGRKTRLLNCSAYPHVTLIEVRPTNCCTEANSVYSSLSASRLLSWRWKLIFLYAVSLIRFRLNYRKNTIWILIWKIVTTLQKKPMTWVYCSLLCRTQISSVSIDTVLCILFCCFLCGICRSMHDIILRVWGTATFLLEFCCWHM